jgi:aspartate 1-decarboxylase
MIRMLLRAVVHNATVTHTESNPPVSLRLDPVVMRAAELLPLEEVELVNLATGARVRTWVQPGADGEVRVHAAAQSHVRAGDVISILAFTQLHAGQTLDHRAKVVTVDAANRVTSIADAPAQF